MPGPALSPLPLRPILRWIALVVLAAMSGYWAFKGAHRGWSQDQVPMKQTDEITGIEYVRYEKRYVPGVDFLLLGGAASAGICALSFIFNRKQRTSQP